MNDFTEGYTIRKLLRGIRMDANQIAETERSEA